MKGKPNMKKRVILLVLVAVSLILISQVYSQQITCCTEPGPRICTLVPKGTCTGYEVDVASSCNETSACNFYPLGCCVDSCIDSNYEAQCPGNFVPGACTQQPECQAGCCVCDKNPLDPNDNRCFPGLTSTDCSDRCSSLEGYRMIMHDPTIDQTTCINLCYTITEIAPGNISGYITDENRNPIANAQVQAATITDTTDSQGYYFLEGVPTGITTVSASKTGYGSAQQTVNMTSRAVLSVNLTLGLAVTGTISGKITDQQTGQPIQGAKIYISGPTLASADSDANGNYVIRLLPIGGGPYTIRATKTGYYDANTTVALTADQPAKIVNLQLVAVPTATLQGVIRDSVGNPIPYAKIFVNGKVAGFSKPVTGDYSVELTAEAGGTDYSVYVIRAGFTPSEIFEITLTQAEVRQLDFALATVLCAYPESRPVPAITAKHIPGVKAVDIGWTLPGACNNLAGYVLIKKQFAGEQQLSEEEVAFLTITPEEHPTKYLDEDVSWSTTYQYSIMAVYSDYIFRNSTSTSSNKITLGNETCEGRYNEEFGKFIEFCIGQYNRRTCDFENKVILPPATFTNPSECSDISPYHFCSGPDFLGLTKCKNVGICSPVLQGATPFGFYFDETTCHGVGNENYCYYDYSTTIVDVCKPCSQEQTCFDYASKSACLKDNCVISEMAGCQWIDTFYTGFGKGICYQENYTESDYCYKCSEGATLFENYGCNQNVCSKLGRCYADATNTNCLSCEDTTKCSDFKSQSLCEGGQPISISDCGATLIPSNDPCNLGTCKWNDASGVCFKDGNDDDVPECNSIPEDYREPCKEDNVAPNTRTAKEFYLASEDTEVTFLTDTDAELLYYCIDHDNTCCPSNQIYVYDGEVSFIPANVPGFRDIYDVYGSISPYYIRFYALDQYQNQEELKNISFYIDLAPPELTIDYDIIPYTSVQPIVSSLAINITTNEVATCSDSLIYVPTGLTKNELISESGDFYILEYGNLTDGLYTYNITCMDSFGNTITKTIKPLIIDSFRYIDIIYPRGPISETSIAFQIKTQDQAVCELYKQGEYFDEFITTDFVTHTTSSHVLGTNTYYPYFEARCTDLTESDKRDAAPIIFTIDQLPPVTTVILKNSEEYSFTKSGWKVGLKGNVLVGFICNETLESSFGCDKSDILYCLSSNQTEDCIPDTPFTQELSLTNNTRICYHSRDKGGNEELVKCGTLLIGEYVGIVMIRPPHNVSNKEVFDVEISIDRETESCRFAAADFEFEELVSPTNQFIKLSPTRFIYHNFSFSLPYPMNIKCKDTKGRINEEPAVFLLEYDPTPPVIINAFADPEQVVQGTFVELNVVTDDLTICKFDKTALLYQYMNGKFEGWVEKTFSRSHTHNIFLTAEDDQKTHNYTVSCQNRAGNLSQTAKIQFSVDFSAAGSIIETLPKGSTKNTNVNITVITNKDAICEYQDGTVWKNFATSGGTRHYEAKTGLSEGKYIFPVRCRFTQSNDLRNGKIEFIVDQTAPIMTKAEDYEFACGRKVQPTFAANDTSPIAYYNYSLYELGTNDEIVGWTAATTNNPLLEDVDIEAGGQYYFRVKAIDAAGNEGTEMSSDGFVVRNLTDPSCEEDNEPPTVTLSTSSTAEGIEVVLDCYDKNGCNAKFYSTSIPPEDCIPQNESYTSPVLLQDTANFCYEVVDGMGNIATGTQLIMVSDEDLDGVTDDKDQCPGTPTGATVDEFGCSPEQKDTDGDGMPDYWEIRYDLDPNDPNDRDEDPDNDGYTNYEEYLNGTDPTVPDLFDSDGDGIPDDKDQCPYTESGKTVDADGCSDSQKDTDGDGMDDEWERRAGLDPNDPTDANADPDGDGLTNLQEYNYYKETGRFIDPNNDDTDGDGWSDKEEIDEGFNPADPNSHPESRFFPLLLLILGLLLIAAGAGYLGYNQYVVKKKPKPFVPPQPAKPMVPPRPAGPSAPAQPAAPTRPAAPAQPPRPAISPAELRRRALAERLRKSREIKSKRREKYFETFGGGKITKPAEKPSVSKAEVKAPVKPAATPGEKPEIKVSVKAPIAAQVPIPKTRPEFDKLTRLTKEHLAKREIRGIPQEKRPEFEKLSKLVERRAPKPYDQPLTTTEKQRAKDIFTHLEKVTTKEEKKRIITKLAKPTETKAEPTGAEFEKLSRLVRPAEEKGGKTTKESFEKISKLTEIKKKEEVETEKKSKEDVFQKLGKLKTEKTEETTAGKPTAATGIATKPKEEAFKKLSALEKPKPKAKASAKPASKPGEKKPVKPLKKQAIKKPAKTKAGKKPAAKKPIKKTKKSKEPKKKK